MKKVLRFLTLVAMLCIPWVTQAQLTLTVHDGSATSSYVPVYGLWADAYLKCEFVVPATELSEMTGGTISQMDFYLTSPAAAAWTGTFQVFIKEVTSATLDAYSGTTGATVVYEGTLDATASTMNVLFSTEYTYGGGNLLVGVYQTVKGNYKSATFAGETVSGASVQGYSSSSLDGVSAGQRNFLPKTTFTYTPPSTGCDMPTSIAMGTITHNSAVVTWEGTGTTFDLQYKKATDVDYTLVENVTSPYTLTSLDGNTAYNVGVRTVCGGTTSYFRSTSFTTANPCAAPTDFVTSNLTPNSVTLGWTAGYQETSWTVKYKKSSEDWAAATTVTATANSLNLTGLDPLTTYNVQVINCDPESNPYLSGNFTTAAGIPVIEGFGTAIPTAWAMYTGLVDNVMAGTATMATATYGWNFGTGNNVFDNHARVNIYGTSCNKWLVMPTIPMEDNVQLTFDMALTVYSSSSSASPTAGNQADDRFIVLASTDNMATWTILREWNNTGSADVYDEITNSATGQAVAIDLSSYAGENVIIAFYGESTASGGDNNLHIDNVRVDYIPSCAIPTALHKVDGTTENPNPTAHTIAVDWTAGDAETAWILAYKGAEDPDWTEVPVTTKPYTLDALAGQTAYSIKVKADCSGTYSEWSNPISVTTAVSCPAPTSVTTTVAARSVEVNWTENGEATEWIVTYRLASGTDDDYDANEVTVLSKPYTITGLEPSTAYIVKVRAACGGIDGNSTWVTKNITTTVACPAPTSLTKTPFVTTAILGWTSTASEFVVKYWVTADGEASATEVTNITENSYTLTGLAATTGYTWKVKAVCGGIDGESQYSSTSTFTTVSACAAVTGLAASAITETGATLSWTAGEATAWVLQYGTDNTFADGTYTEENPTAPTITLTGLTTNTVYYARVKVSGCDGSDENWGTVVSFEPTNKIVVGSGTSTNSYLPTNTNYDYSYTQQIYTAAELGAAGAIMSVDFYMTSTSAYTRNLDIYMVQTTKTAFEGTSDWVAVTAADKVFSGDVAFVPQAWTTIDFDSPFLYDGTNNVVLVVDDNTNVWSSRSFKSFTVTGNQSHYAYQDNTDIDPAAPTASYNNVTTSKNQARFLIGVPPTCDKPTGLTVNYTGGTTAEVSWTSTATAWNLDVNGTVTAVTENPYTLTGLSLSTTYNVMVQADCGSDGTSEWTSVVSFTTDDCMDPTIVNYSLVDSYGDGWNGNEIVVLDEDDNVVAELTIASGSSNTGVLKLCGSYYAFYWSAGSYPGECSFSFTDGNGNDYTLSNGGTGSSYSDGDLIFEIGTLSCAAPINLIADNIGNHSAELSWTERGTSTAWTLAYKEDGASDFTEVNVTSNPYTLIGLDPETDYIWKVTPTCATKWSSEETFTTDVACPNPTALTITPTPTSATVAWTGFGSSYTMQYAEGAIPIWLQYDDDNCVTNLGGSSSAEWTWGVMYPAAMLHGITTLAKVAIFENASYHTNNITVNIYSDGDDEPGTLIGTETVTPMGTTGIHEVTLSTPLTIDPAQNLWITLTTTATYAMPMCEVGEPNNQWVYYNSTWRNVGDLGDFGTKGWMIRAYLDSGNDPATMSWTSVTNATSPATITGLNPETNYTVRVKADCGTDGESGWTYDVFATLSNCVVPNALTATDVTATTATLGWTGYQEAFNVRYRTAPVENPTFFDDFESGLTQWTTVANDYDASGTNWHQFDGSFTTPIPAHGGTYMAMSRSYDGSDQSVDNWLISPQVTLDGTLRFWARNDDGAGYAEHYEIYVSTTTNDISNFTSIYVPADADDWTEYSVDLSSYAGALGYIAIRHNDYGQDFLLIDDFGIYAAGTPAGAWVEVNGVAAAANPTANTINVTGLTSGTEYEFQVQGINAGCTGGVTDWSSRATFTTMEELVMTLNADQWYLLSAPLANQGNDETVDAVSELISHTYDLYRFDEPSGVWENYDAHSGDFTTLEQGRGYLYRNTSDVDITFVGVRRTGDIDYDLSYSCPDPDLMGFNLVGNPYMHCIALSNDFYTLNTDGVWEIQSGGGNIGIAEGALVQTDVVNDIVPFEDMACSKSARSKASATAGLAFTVTDGRYTDMAYARFENGTGLKKISHLNNEAPMMSIPVDGRNYAIANLDESTESFPLNFNGKGEYTLQVATNGATFGYLHLIDKEAGKDIDLLRQPLYTFKSNGSTDRFTVVLSSDGNQSGFVHVSGNSVIVDGEGDLQVFDVMGRQMGTMHVDGSTTLDRNALGMVHAGVYVLRLNGNSQKIVVK